MNALMAVGALLVALTAQYLNRYKSLPAPAIKLALASVGLILYGFGRGWPAGWGDPFLVWLDDAWIWALAIPGAASLIGAIPGMETNSVAGIPGKEVK